MARARFSCVRYLRLSLIGLIGLAGCPSMRLTVPAVDRKGIKERALRCLRAAIRYEHNPVVRLEAVEAFESSGCAEGLPWIRTALLDEHPAVRFAACVVVGRLSDTMARQGVRRCLDQGGASVRVGALFALHRLGYTEGTGRLPTYLLHHEDATVRRNAALVLGLLGERDGIKVLARAMRDRDEGVRHHALEAMARLGNREAKRELIYMTRAGIGSEEVFAINALAGTRDPTYGDTFRYTLATAAHLETRLSAARALGRLGSDEGFAVALGALQRRRVFVKDANDPPPGQILRAVQMAAAALGAIGRVDAIRPLLKRMDDPADPRVQVSAARAVLEILKADRLRGLPFSTTDAPR